MHKNKELRYSACAIFARTIVRLAILPRAWDDAEVELRTEWEKDHGQSTLSWDEAKPAARDAWDSLASVTNWTGWHR